MMAGMIGAGGMTRSTDFTGMSHSAMTEIGIAAVQISAAMSHAHNRENELANEDCATDYGALEEDRVHRRDPLRTRSIRDVLAEYSRSGCESCLRPAGSSVSPAAIRS